jgi:cbb3-type cytochrome oxidase subunit 3
MARLSDIVGASGLSGYAVVALILFVVAFLLVLATLLLPRSRARHERAALLPFDDDAIPTSVSSEVTR